jgi:hypothetical protein
MMSGRKIEVGAAEPGEKPRRVSARWMSGVKNAAVGGAIV